MSSIALRSASGRWAADEGSPRWTWRSVLDDRPAPRARTVDARRDIRRWNGLGRSGLRLLPSRDGRSRRALSAESTADPRHPRGGRARARGRDAADAGDDRHARRPNVASATALRGDRLRLLGHSVLRLPAHHLWLARLPVRLGHSLSVAAAVVGAGARAR